MKMGLKEERKGRETRQKKIKWWKLKEPEAKRQFREKVMEEWVEADSVQNWRRENSEVMRKAGEEMLGRTSGKRAPADKETLWWNDEVQRMVKRKKKLKKNGIHQGVRRTRRDTRRQRKMQSMQLQELNTEHGTNCMENWKHWKERRSCSS